MRLSRLLVNVACETELDARRCCKCEAESHPATLTNRASSSGTGWFFRDWFLKAGDAGSREPLQDLKRRELEESPKR